MKNKIEAKIEFNDYDKPVKIVGILDEMHYDSNNPILTLEIRDVRFKEERNVEDYIEPISRKDFKFKVADFVEDIIQEKLKEIGLNSLRE